MAAVTICSGFGVQENKICHCSHFFSFYLPWSDGTECHDLSFLMLSFKPAFSLASFTLIKRLFGGWDGKESTCNAEDSGFIPRSGISLGEGNGYWLQYSCLENSTDRGAWRATINRSPRVGHNWVTNTFTSSLFAFTVVSSGHLRLLIFQIASSLQFTHLDILQNVLCM